MTRANRYRGRPLLALSIILAAWVGARVVMLDYDSLVTPPNQISPFLAKSAGKPVAGPAQPMHSADIDEGRGTIEPVPFATMPQRPSQLRVRAPESASLPLLGNRAAGEPKVSTSLAAGHHMLWMAALARMPVPVIFAADAAASQVPAPFYPAGGGAAKGSRWSADGWLMLRHGGVKSLATGAAPTTYGASQTGAVIRYRLNSADARKPTVYLRGTAALEGVDEKEAALGFSARPIRSLPVLAALEVRLSDQPSGMHLRPSAMAVTEFAPLELPLATRAEFYAQAGYVGGKFATAFADGQMRIDTRIAEVGRGELRAGGGAWAGAQKGASRVDVGPTAVIGLPLGDSGFARLGVDWRLRVGGDAMPGSGPAMTLSAGF